MAVYLARVGADGPVKIGLSRNPPARLRALQTAHPAPLSLLRVIEGGRQIERWFHRRFAHLRAGGEWFGFSPDMLSIVPPHVNDDPREFPIIQKLGGRTAVFAVLKEREVVQTEAALRMQTTRGSLSADTQRALMAMADERGIAYSASDFILPPAEKARRKRAAA